MLPCSEATAWLTASSPTPRPDVSVTVLRVEKPGKKMSRLICSGLSLIVTELQLPPSREVWGVLAGVFARYASHDLSPVVPDPPGAWRHPYLAMATAIQHPVTDMDEAVRAVQRFLDNCRTS